jgi:hypothetical protein
VDLNKIGDSTMPWSTSRFGKYGNKTLPQIMFMDPDWFYWMYSNKKFKDNVVSEADDIFRKSCSIKILQRGNSLELHKKGDVKWVAEYSFSPFNEKFVGLEIVPEDRQRHSGSTETIRLDVIDMSIPFRQASYDKSGSRLIVKQIKGILFGDKSHRMIKKRCENFFSDSNNFV